jgi:hypothetical protein
MLERYFTLVFFLLLLAPQHKYLTQEPLTLSYTQQQSSMPDQSSMTIFTQFHTSVMPRIICQLHFICL